MRQPVPFGKYLLLDRISVGGMAEVFKAKSYGVEGFEKIIAIKRILPTMGEDRDFIKMFIDEAKIAGQLAHANICQIFELGRIDGSHFIAMEYIWGKDLLQIGNRARKLKQQMPVPMACFIIAKVLEGLDYAHRKRDPLGRPLEIVHRDCSPQNVLVSYEGEVKVIDFGIAKATSRNSRTMAGVLKGKFGYMSPEQVRGLPLDRRSDIFALGTMLFECLTGERLFQGETDFSTLEKVRNVDVQSPRAINPNIPESIERVIMKALAKDVEDRYQWCSEMLGDLQQYLMSQDVVFTAKSLSSWLKDMFTGDIDKERSLLEQYKRVGRDGLIAGVPAADAKVDVVATLGEAGMPEGDATQLGGPDFADLENAIAAKASVGPAPKAAPRGATDGDSDFGEEAPTEIFGEIDEPKPAMPTPAAGRSPAGSPPKTSPPRPPPRTTGPQAPQMAAMAGIPSGSISTQRPAVAPVAESYPAPSPPESNPSYPPQAYGSNPGAANAPYGMAGGTPVSSPVLPGPGANNNKTLLGAVSPVAGNYGPGYRVSAQQPAAYPPSAAYPAAPSQPHIQQGYPSQPQMPYAQSQPYPSAAATPSQPHMQQGYPSEPSYQNMAPAAPVEQLTAPIEGRRRSSIGRDVAIGVAIAAVVLGGFLAVKFLVLDKGDKGTGTSASQSSIANIKLTLPQGVSAELWVDDKKVDFVDGKDVPINAGRRKVRIVTPNGKCEQVLDLPGGKTIPVECTPKGPATAAGSGAVATGSGAGSAEVAASGSGAGSGSGSATVATPAAGSGSGSATVATPAAGSASGLGSAAGAGSGSAATPAIDKPVVVTKPDDKKPADKPIVVAKPDDKKPVDKPIVVAKPDDKKPADKPIVVTKPPVDKPPVEKKPKITKPAEPAAEAKGYLVVSTNPPAKVIVDGADTGLTTPISGKQLPLSPGKHKITFSTGDVKVTYTANIKAGATESWATKQLE